jgi:hypothetical protein
MVHRREVDGEPVMFGNQGALWQRAMTWWDHETGSVWSQPLGEAVAGPLAGERLELLPSTLTEWATWRRMHPDTLALDAAGGRTSFRLEDTLIVVEVGDEAVGYTPRSVAEVGVWNDTVGGVPVAVFVSPDDPQQWAVFSRQLDEEVADLELRDGLLTDQATDAAWDPVSGASVRGTDEPLDPLAAFTAFDADFRSFFPDGRVVGQGPSPDSAARMRLYWEEPTER